MEEKPIKKFGRPFGSKDSFTRKTRVKKSPNKGKEISVVTSKKSLIHKHLKGEVKKLYKEFDTEQGITLEELIELAKKMRADITLSEVTHKNSWEMKVRNAREALKELENDNKINGRKVQDSEINTRKRNLQKDIHAPYYIDSKITTLRGEYLKVLSEIDRIESGRIEGSISIYQIMSGKGDLDKNVILKRSIFKLPEELMEEEDFDDIDVEGNAHD